MFSLCSCFHKHPGVFYGAFVVPILIIVIFNLVIFIWVVVILVRIKKEQQEVSKEHMKPKTALRLMLSIISLIFLFGLNWLFAGIRFTFRGDDALTITFQALFTVSTSFQGFFIFLFLCVLNKEARESWRELLSCGRYKSEFLHPLQYSTSQRNKLKMKTESTPITCSTAASKSTVDSTADSLPEKRDLGKAEEGTHTEIPLTSTNGANESTVNESLNTVPESKLDGEEDKK